MMAPPPPSKFAPLSPEVKAWLDDPALMTPVNLLRSSLELFEPPLWLVRSILELSPRAANAPPVGPTPLQTALRHNASVEVVDELVRACPYALFVGNGGFDPVSYARVWRSDEKELVDLLRWSTELWNHNDYRGRHDHHPLRSTTSSFGEEEGVSGVDENDDDDDDVDLSYDGDDDDDDDDDESVRSYRTPVTPSSRRETTTATTRPPSSPYRSLFNGIRRRRFPGDDRYEPFDDDDDDDDDLPSVIVLEKEEAAPPDDDRVHHVLDDQTRITLELLEHTQKYTTAKLEEIQRERRDRMTMWRRRRRTRSDHERRGVDDDARRRTKRTVATTSGLFDDVRDEAEDDDDDVVAAAREPSSAGEGDESERGTTRSSRGRKTTRRSSLFAIPIVAPSKIVKVKKIIDRNVRRRVKKFFPTLRANRATPRE